MNSKLPNSEKQAIIFRYLSSEKISDLVQEIGIPCITLYSWIKVHKEQECKKQPKLTVRAFMDFKIKLNG